MKNSLVLTISILCVHILYAQNSPDAILGKWITETGNCIVDVFKIKDEYRASVVWFKDTGNKPMTEWTDEHNPDKSLRTRKLLGMEVLRGLQFNPRENEYTGGVIYDATTGKKWNSVVWLTHDHLLKVKGYWLFRWICQTKTFKKV